MSNLVPDPGDRNDSQITPVEKRDPVDLYFQDLIAQERRSLDSATEIDEKKKKLELIQIALNLEGQIVDLKEKKNEASRKDENFQLQLAQDKVKLDIAKIDSIDRQTKSIEVKFKTFFKLAAIPIFTSAGIYIWYTSDSILGSALLFLGLRLALSDEDLMKNINTIKDLMRK